MYLLKKAIVVFGLAILPLAVLAQKSNELVYKEKQVEPDQELSPIGVATDEFRGIHTISADIRGVRGANGVVYWVDKDKKILSAYRGEKLVWQVNVAEAFKTDFAQPQIEKLIFCSNMVFVSVSKTGFAEVDRESGQLGSKTVY